MSGGKAECDCVNCKSTKTYGSQRPAGHKVSAIKPSVHSLGASARVFVDVQTNPAQKYIDLLYRDQQRKTQHSALEFNCGDPIGWNYRLFNPHIEYKSAHHGCHSFEPRENEIVLFYEEQSAVRLEENTQYFKLFSETTQQFGGWPKWEAGRVISTPEPGQISLKDLHFSASGDQKKSTKKLCIEVLPSDTLSCSSPRRVNLNISHVRPFSMLRELQHGKHQNDWQDNIMPTAFMMSKLFLIKPCAFTRLFSGADASVVASESLNAKFRCRGIWIGGEKIIEGDVVRLMPLHNQTLIDRVLIVKEISYVYEYLEAVVPTGGAFLEGRCLTVTQPDSNSKAVVRSTSSYEELALQGLPKSMRGYTWYEVENPYFNCRLPPESVVGRCYEREAMELLIYAPDLNIGLDGVHQTRQWAMMKGHNDQRGWIWAEHRFETENNVRLNDLRVGRSRSLECGGALAGLSISGFDHQSFENPSVSGGDSHEGTYGRLGKMSIISGSVIEDEADKFVRQTLEGSFDDDEAGAEHVAKKIRICDEG